MNMPTTLPVTCHTDYITAGSTFVAIKGDKYNGISYIPLALTKGATTIVVHQDEQLDELVSASIAEHQAQITRVANTRAALAHLSAQAAGNPADRLSIIGITGTKGKTTITYALEHILRHAGIKTARITGVSNSINGHEIPANLTTPQPDYLHQFFKLCIEKNVTHVVMEVAAQALSLHRVDTIIFDRVIFTNIAREHFEFYKDMDDYFNAKSMILDHLSPTGICLVNGDDERCATLTEKKPSIIRYGLWHESEIKAHDVSTKEGVAISFNNTLITCPTLIGHYNASNLLAACAIAQSYGITEETIQQALNTLPPIPGRMEKYQLPNGATCIIDYAHNPSSYEALLSTLRPLTDHLIVLFGASGSRDSGKRPLMGSVAAIYADIVILTSDNPGIVDPLSIIENIAAGIEHSQMHKVIKEIDRARAIDIGYKFSRPGSLLVLLGKGTDEYQVIGTHKHHFSERTLVQNL